MCIILYTTKCTQYIYIRVYLIIYNDVYNKSCYILS